MGSDNSDEEDRERILAPDDLDITAQPEVEEIDDGRYVVSPDGPAKKPDRDLLENPDWLNNDEEDEEMAPQPSDDPSPPRESRQEQSTPQQPQPDNRSTPQAGGQNQQPPGNNQPDGQNKQQPNNKPGGRGQQSPNTQSGGRGQQSPTNQGKQTSTNTQSGGRKQQSSTNQSGNRDQQQSPTAQSNGRNQQSGNRNQQSTGGRNQQSTGGGSPTPSSSELAAHDQPPVEPPAVELTNENVSRFLAEELTQGGDSYGFDATLNVEGEVNRGRMTSDDVGETLETLLRWYARQTTEEVDPESVLGIILAGSDLAVEYPVQSIYTVVKRHDLKPDDSISDLLAAVRKEGSFTVPPSEE
jgi:hypothetical protein